ncbi:hypothetical protein PQX77_019879 [Marasmius sp. AFHP31]|nr:hypothetical protein PQX77_019879 [Marasmius sp. AFHP31]
MEPNLGGIKIENASKVAVTSRHGNSPTVMFILTDGEVWDDDNMANRIILSPRSLSTSHNTRLEILALGIGSGVSIQMYQDIPRAGNGVWQKTSSSAASGYRLPAEHLLSRTSRFQLATSPVPIRPLRLSTFYGVYPNLPNKFRAVLKVSSTMELHPQKKHPSQKKSPSEVVSTESPQPLSYELTIPIRNVQLKDSEPRLPTLMLKLTASHLMDEHEKSRALLLVPPGARTLRRAAIVRFGAEVSVG